MISVDVKHHVYLLEIRNQNRELFFGTQSTMTVVSGQAKVKYENKLHIYSLVVKSIDSQCVNVCVSVCVCSQQCLHGLIGIINNIIVV